jgi:hypothetical protein
MLENDSGADFLPMRLATVLVISSLVLVSTAVYVYEVAGQSTRAAARDCALKIAATAMAEYTESCPGRGYGAIVSLSVPDCVRTITFGRGPANGATGRTGTCSIQYADGSSELHLTGVPLGSGCQGPGRGGPLVLYPGKYSIRICTEEVDGSVMALLHVEGR